MTMTMKLRMILLAGTVGFIGLGASEQFALPRLLQFCLDRRGHGRASAHACQRRRDGAAHGAALRGRRVQLLANRKSGGGNGFSALAAAGFNPPAYASVAASCAIGIMASGWLEAGAGCQ